MAGVQPLNCPSHEPNGSIQELSANNSALQIIEIIAKSCQIDLVDKGALERIFVGAEIGYYEDGEMEREKALKALDALSQSYSCATQAPSKDLPFTVLRLALAIELSRSSK